MNTEKSASAKKAWVVLATPWSSGEIAFEHVFDSPNDKVLSILMRHENGFSAEWEDESEQVFLVTQHDNAESFRKYTIHQLCLIVDRLGSHPEFEKRQQKTTPRKMFQIIRDLRMEGVPIVGDVDGLWIARSEQEVNEFCDRLEQKAKSDIASMMTLRKRMLENTNRQPSLFDKWFGDFFKLD